MIWLPKLIIPLFGMANLVSKGGHLVKNSSGHLSAGGTCSPCAFCTGTPPSSVSLVFSGYNICIEGEFVISITVNSTRLALVPGTICQYFLANYATVTETSDYSTTTYQMDAQVTFAGSNVAVIISSEPIGADTSPTIFYCSSFFSPQPCASFGIVLTPNVCAGCLAFPFYCRVYGGSVTVGP